ncbi:potassium channel subfamily K member 10-like [Haliotis rufescens]|uniref:potassium channel subfamily K member 10-like n=1 Tax=Haliotis rufescens TaxID=6454 RepID=UPI001EB0741C|nr:potassium channel subfamily K member 10-like [Haliotis rufescens]XP_048259732.1 potassium channel subfamily K member 10-like [Haliotis rufescens]
MEPGTRRLIILVVINVFYLCMGGVIFSKLEAEAERTRMGTLRSHIEEFLGNNSCVSRDVLHELLKHASQDKELVSYAVENRTNLDRWDFGGAFGFAVSVVTTIGFGNMSPSTIIGKIVCVFYAIVGIPVTMLMLSGLGQQLAGLSNKVNQLKLCSQKPVVNKVLNMVLIIVLGLALMFGLPSFVFHIVEGWDIMEALYFCFTTLSTIGFGDYIIGIHEKKISAGPARDAYEIAAYVWILLGLSYLSLVIKYITDVLVQNASKMERKTLKRFENEIGRLDELKNGVVPNLRKNKLSKSNSTNSVSTAHDKNVQLVSINHL